jgi:hypothetical protein
MSAPGEGHAEGAAQAHEECTTSESATECTSKRISTTSSESAADEGISDGAEPDAEGTA